MVARVPLSQMRAVAGRGVLLSFVLAFSILSGGLVSVADEYRPRQVADLNCTGDVLEHSVTLAANETFVLTCPTNEWQAVPANFHQVMCPRPGLNCTDAEAAPYVAFFPLSKSWKWVTPDTEQDTVHAWTTPVGKYLNMRDAPLFSVGCRHRTNKTLCYVNVTVKAAGSFLLAGVTAAQILAVVATSAAYMI
ncbi:hypothetical protein BESB_060020 [Besnoitia besnoiti]|uniref:SRS domain-containing protein n=1 Tax=Besnoitia besnoiti TaxID=94643 RepID=A0A2A9MAV5_BESBE|nr:hypothetical protein BESB_060020 [Besnoitia besnoiti]PFH35115.1 hypothetical protein BESB_060020 [Besnoitia besnoiti]